MRLLRLYRRYKHFINRAVGAVLGKQSIDDLDKNKNGNIDQSEAEELMERRAAEDLLSLADENDPDLRNVLEEFADAFDSE